MRCSALAGEALNLSRRVTVRAQFLTCDGSSLVCAELQALVTDCVHSLLSLGFLVVATPKDLLGYIRIGTATVVGLFCDLGE